MLVKLKKYIATALIVLLAFVAAAGGLLAPEPAHAQLATFTFGDIPAQLKDIGAQIYKALISALKVATVRTVAYAVRKVSYDSAVWLASGAKGQNPFAQTKDFGSYIKSLGDDVAGTFIEQMGTDKLNLCHVPDIKVDLAMKIGLRTDFGGAGGIGGGAAGPGKPKCSLSQMAGNWSQEFDSKYGASSIAGRMTSINNLFQADSNSDLGIQIQTTEKLANTVQQQVVAGTLERQEGRGFKGKETPISGQIQTPAELIAEQFKANTPDKAAKEDSDTVKQALTSDEPSVLAVGLSIFLNTLVSTAITNFRDKGTLPTAVETPGGTKADSISDIPTGGTQVAAEFYRELQTVKINEVANYDVLSQLTSCPDVPGTYNCRANDDLVTALKRADAGEPVTIDQALKQGWLHGAWPLIPPSSAKNNDRDCYQSNYCYSNIQVLRQLRILPLGFEIAAKNSNPDRPWTLAQVEEGFDNCTFIDPNDHSKGIVDDPVGHPFCRLIDPDWVLKSPLTKCKIKAPGPLLASAGVPNRLEDCMDVQTCVHYTADGVCDNYGYCTREADKWKFKAEECAPYAATCRTFTNAVSGASASYLQRTLDTGFCSEQNIGCTAYSLTQQNGRWQAPKIQGADQGFTNAGIYFNKNISNSCSANSEGCSAFLVGGGRTNDLLYLKKAPDYLKCYDANPATAAVEWPQSVADLTRIKLNAAAACGNYAAACIPEEVSCNLYTPGAGGEAVPGRYTPHEIAGGQIKWNDECDQSCVGYAAYREMPGRYSVGQPVAYVIPRSEAVCSAAAAGCTGFTNLQTTSGGLEQVEYFSYLRPCANPEKEKGKLYITYEGSQAGGFQLKTYILVENNDTANGPVGAPKYFYRDDAELQNNLAECNEQRYKEGKAAADCRQFNDEQGHIYYRLLSFTIPVTAACTPYRLSNPELDSNGKCLQNGEYRDGSCFYSGLPSGTQNTAGASQTCSAAVDTCRAYKGTEAGKAGQVFSDTFESPSTTVALSGWSGSVSLSTESTRAKEHSLQIIGSGAKKVDLDAAASFDAIFWAKGSGGGTLTVQLKRSDGAEQDFGTVGIGDAWQQYHLGPIELDGASTVGGSYIFTVAGGGQVWVDNVTLNHSVDVKYLVKKKLTVPAACDSNPNDNLPGEALGCTAYTAANNNPVNLVNFSQLCRAEAIGCTAALNTQNTVTAVNGRYQSGDEGARAYNVFLTGKGGVTAKAVIGADSYSCAVPVGAAGCYLDKPILNHSAAEIQAAAGVSFVKSTVFIPGDTPADKPIYLVASKPATCSQLDLGCTLAGVAKATPTGVTYVTTTIKNDPNDPDGYTKTLCQAEAVGCQKYTDTANSSFYFKDPDIVGQKICAYKTDVLIGGIKKNGWFWKGVGVCTAANQTNNGVICGDNSDCAGGYTCQGKDVQPCYPDYIQNGNSYGLWSYGNADKYQNFVGACQSGQDKCTEFVDHVKTDRSNPAKSIDRAYYLINDPSKLNPGDCAGGASQKAGCTLLDQTDNPNKYWSRDLSYQASDAKGGAKVAPVNSADQARPNDTNVLFKVVRDRDCGEWLGCSYTRTVFDSAIGNFKDTCENIQRCDKPGSCGVLKSAYTGNILTEERYRARAVGWNGDHFSGYSILGLFPVEELEDVNFEETGKGAPDFRLVKKVACGAVNCASGSTCTTNDTACGNGGWCVNHTCVRSIVGESVSSANLDLQPKQACRGYPEKDSPFPSLDFGRNAPDYALANTCAEKRAADGSAYLCDCDYTKIGFGQVMKYWNYTNPGANGIDHAAGGTVTEVAKINGVCIGGPNGLRGEEKACDKDSDCGKGICQPKDKESRVLGLKGYCLEYDTTRNLYGDASKHPCLTWYPGKLNGVPDLFNQYVDAGFNISSFGY
ncbi:MAG: hypothetical protein HY983_02680, partial [Candidatus Magasanikbacteria bacterium]|nr:hypothetical protein [Candidatus Magasanikbacteria bacterium]